MKVPIGYRSDFFALKKILSGIKDGSLKKGLPYSESFVLQQNGYIKPKWRRMPYTDNPSRMNKVFDGWRLTEKGKRFLKGLEKLY